ncbi:endoglucanase [Motilibacter rhizosphaerae]|uniref:Endoglucanase n=1 Tax=Motilibacter rhizosphaerae TaxID=598652 RepID=A0A4Q7NSC4_9ACTN|nr:glycoside hydrolase family 9 protein [Motilibacter rhizosphaerae]RZS87560.1 endoglucanase [Motilibacter rhizosphaerae]
MSPFTPRRQGAGRTLGRSTALSGAVGLVLLGTTAPAASADEPEQVVNGSFSNGTTGWEGYPAFAVQDGAGCLTVPAGTGAYSAAIRQPLKNLVKGATYAFTFTAWASVDGGSADTVAPYPRVVIQGGADVNYAAAFPSTKVNPTGAHKQYTYSFTENADLGATPALEFSQDISNDKAYTFCIDDVSVKGGAEVPVYTPDTGPRVRVNQVGYLPAGPKGATLVTTSTDPLPWQLENAGGTVVASGVSTPKGVDPTAGLNVHTIDFTSYTTPGTGYTLVADGQTSYPFAISGSAYDQLREDSKTVFYTQRSGTPILDSVAPGYGRAAGHVGVAPNTGDTAVPCQSLSDDSQKILVKQGDAPWTCDYTSDVTGGWYDAGDQGKYVVNGGIAVGQLLQEFERTKDAPSTDAGALGDSTLRVPERGNAVPDILDEAKWELDFFLKMQVKPGHPLAGMVFHKVADANWTGLPLDPAHDPQQRVLYRPSTAATLNVAATAAQGARLFAPYDAAYAQKLLQAAKTAYAAAKANPALYAPAPDASLDPNPGSGPYDDSNVTDEFYWAASELYLTTGDSSFRSDVLASPWNSAATSTVFTHDGFDWGHVAALARLDLATVPNALPGRAAIRQSVIDAADQYLADQAAQPFGQAYAPAGGNYAWGSNSSILNNMQVIGTAYDLTDAAKYRDGVERSMDYLLGRNALNQSYITGYGTKYSHNQHSRIYSHELDPSLPNPPSGTIAGGPNSTTLSTGDPVAAATFTKGCITQFCYLDDIGAWSLNELTINWNAPLSWVSSFLADQDNGADLQTTPLQAGITLGSRNTTGPTSATLVVSNPASPKKPGAHVSSVTFALPTAFTVSSKQKGVTVSQDGAFVTVTLPAYSGTVYGGKQVSVSLVLTPVLDGQLARTLPEQFWIDGVPAANG